MRLALVGVLTAALGGCAPQGVLPLSPNSPSPVVPNPPVPVDPDPLPSPPRMTSVWVVVLRLGSGACVEDATVEIVAGQGVGRRSQQSNGCSYWDPGNAGFDHVVAGVELTLRASAPGYEPAEQSVIPATGEQYAVTFELSKTQ